VVVPAIIHTGRTNSEYAKIACYGKPPPGNPERGGYERERDRGTSSEPFAPELVGRGKVLSGDAQGLRARTEARSSCHPTACPGVEAIAQVELAVISLKSAHYELAANGSRLTPAASKSYSQWGSAGHGCRTLFPSRFAANATGQKGLPTKAAQGGHVSLTSTACDWLVYRNIKSGHMQLGLLLSRNPNPNHSDTPSPLV